MDNNIIKNELIDKAFNIGFKSYFGLMVGVNKNCYHLWLCDLQKYLRDKKILVEALPIDDWNIWTYRITLKDCMSPFFEYKTDINEYDNYVDALENGLLEALNI